MTENKPVFSKQQILEKQKKAREEYDLMIRETRQAFEVVASTPEGEKTFRFLFLLCGGDKESIRRDKEGNIDMNDTLAVLGAKSVWETLRFHLSSELVKKIERHTWE